MRWCPGHNSAIAKFFGRKIFRNRQLSNSRGFNLVELMIVVAIIGILASVAIPLYMGYIQKSRFKSLVFPGLHIIESNIGLHYAINNSMPDASMLPNLWHEANTDYFHVNLNSGGLVITIDSPAPESKLSKLHGLSMTLTPNTGDFRISSWELTGVLARKLGINTK